MNRHTAAIAAIAMIASLVATENLHAQKTYISRCTGSAILLKGGGTAVKAEDFYPIGYGDIIATGDGGAELGTNGGFRATVSPNTVLAFCYSGPLSSAQSVIELVAGTVTFSDSGNGEFSPRLAVEGREIRATGETRTETVVMDDSDSIRSRVESITAELADLETRYKAETTRLNLVNERYRDLVAAAEAVEAETNRVADTGTAAGGVNNAASVAASVAAFKAETLFPAEDARSEIVGKIARRETVMRAIRLFAIAPRYMREKSARPYDTPVAGANVDESANYGSDAVIP